MNEDRSRQRLGRGLASLIGGGVGPAPVRPSSGGAPAPAAELGGERHVAVGRLSPNPRNPRRSFDEAELGDLAASIKAHGVVQPILVRPKAGTDGAFEIVAGERRWRASQLAGLAEVPVVVRAITDRESLEIAIIENVQRTDLNAIEEALAYQLLIDEHGYTQADLAEVLGKSRSHVANTLRLLKLPDAVRALVVRGELSPGHARTAVSAADPEAFARLMLDKGLTVREAEDLLRRPQPAGEESGDKPAYEAEAPVARRAAPRVASASDDAGVGAIEPPRPAPSAGGQGDKAPAPAAAALKDADTLALERLLTEALGMRVEIRLQAEGGDIRIDYRNLDQLDEICRLLQARQSAARASEPRIRTL